MTNNRTRADITRDLCAAIAFNEPITIIQEFFTGSEDKQPDLSLAAYNGFNPQHLAAFMMRDDILQLLIDNHADLHLPTERDDRFAGMTASDCYVYTRERLFKGPQFVTMGTMAQYTRPNNPITIKLSASSDHTLYSAINHDLKSVREILQTGKPDLLHRHYYYSSVEWAYLETSFVHLAVQIAVSEHSDILQLLIDNNANLNVTIFDGTRLITPLDYAIAMKAKYNLDLHAQQTIDLLVKHGAKQAKDLLKMKVSEEKEVLQAKNSYGLCLNPLGLVQGTTRFYECYCNQVNAFKFVVTSETLNYLFSVYQKLEEQKMMAPKSSDFPEPKTTSLFRIFKYVCGIENVEERSRFRTGVNDMVNQDYKENSLRALQEGLTFEALFTLKSNVLDKLLSQDGIGVLKNKKIQFEGDQVKLNNIKKPIAELTESELVSLFHLDKYQDNKTPKSKVMDNTNLQGAAKPGLFSPESDDPSAAGVTVPPPSNAPAKKKLS